MSYSSYVGRRDSPDFFWDDIPDQKYRIANIPRRLVPEHGAELPFSIEALEDWSKRLGRESRRLDWGARGLELNKRELRAIWDAQDRSAYALPRWKKIAAEIDRLPEDAMYVLIVAENP